MEAEASAYQNRARFCSAQLQEMEARTPKRLPRHYRWALPTNRCKSPVLAPKIRPKQRSASVAGSIAVVAQHSWGRAEVWGTLPAMRQSTRSRWLRPAFCWTLAKRSLPWDGAEHPRKKPKPNACSFFEVRPRGHRKAAREALRAHATWMPPGCLCA